MEKIALRLSKEKIYSPKNKNVESATATKTSAVDDIACLSVILSFVKAFFMHWIVTSSVHNITSSFFRFICVRAIFLAAI